MRHLLIIAIISIIVTSCNKKTKYANVPKLTFREVSPSIVQAGGEGNVNISFLFEDGDGNIGFGTNNLFLKDSRDTQLIPYTIPDIPDKFNPESGLKGIMLVQFPAAFLLLRADSLHKDSDTLTWNIYLKDKVGNISNTITTTPLILTK